MIEKDDPKRKELCEKVIETVNEQYIKFIYLQFTDMHGIIKSFEINSKRIEDFLQDGENLMALLLQAMEQLKNQIKLPSQTLVRFE